MMQLRRLRDLKHYALFARDGEIGQIEQIHFDDEQWLVRYFVVHTGGWLLGRNVLIAPRSVAGMDEKNKHIALDLGREQVENAPPVDRARPVSRHDEAEYHRHYGWPPYWEISAFGMAIPPLEPPAESVSEPADPHLRDSGEVMGITCRRGMANSAMCMTWCSTIRTGASAISWWTPVTGCRARRCSSHPPGSTG